MVGKCAHVDESALVDLMSGLVANRQTAPLTAASSAPGSADRCGAIRLVLHLWQCERASLGRLRFCLKGMPVECENVCSLNDVAGAGVM
jgi:hypothetical protein